MVIRASSWWLFPRLVPLAAMLAFAARAEGPKPARALIWAGGVTAEAGAAALQRYHAETSGVGAVLQLTAGFPRVVESQRVPGLKPGFHVVLLGLCAPADAELPLVVAKSVAPQVYARPVEVPTAELGCPALAPGWRVSDTRRAGSMISLVLTNPTGRVEVLGGSVVPYRWLVFLEDASGELLDLQVLTESEQPDEPAPAVEGTAITSKFVLAGGPLPCEGVLSRRVDVVRFEARGKQLQKAVREGRWRCE